MDYSVIIRTIGKAGEKYQRLLTSIKQSEIQPKEIIVVLPEGYDPPSEKLGTETYLFCKKGMVNQRLVGIHACKTPYALILDDDIAFEPDFIEIVSAPVAGGAYGLSAGPLTEFFPDRGKQTFLSAVMGLACPTVFHKNRYNTVLNTTGYSYNRHIRPGRLYETQSAPWTCFFADIEKLKSIRFDDECWLDMHGYSAYDDTAMFYKAWLCGVKSVIVADASYQHLDAGTSRNGVSTQYYYNRGFNSYIFWKRLLCCNKNTFSKTLSYIPFRYHELVCGLFYRLLYGKKASVAYRQGCREARTWVKSDAYRALPRIICRRSS